MIFPKGQEIVYPFLSVTATTGETFTKVVFCNTKNKSASCRVVELGSGFYAWRITPDEEGVWFVDLVGASNPLIHYQTTLQVSDIEQRLEGQGFNARTDSLSNIKRLLQIVSNDKQQGMAEDSKVFR